jgi:hypothetical protein
MTALSRRPSANPQQFATDWRGRDAKRALWSAKAEIDARRDFLNIETDVGL